MKNNTLTLLFRKGQTAATFSMACLILLSSCEKTTDSIAPKKKDIEILTQDIDLPEVEIVGYYGGYIPEYGPTRTGNVAVKDDGIRGGGGGGGGYNASYGTSEITLSQAGDKSYFMKKSIYNGKAIMAVLAEVDSQTEKIEKTSVIVRTTTLTEKLQQVGDGVSSYDPWSDSYSFTIYYQLMAQVPSLGELAAGSVFKITGKFNATTGRYNYNIIKVM